MLATFGLPLVSGLAAFLAFDFVYSLYRNAADARTFEQAAARVEHEFAPLHSHLATLPQAHGCVSLGLTVLNEVPVSVILDTLSHRLVLDGRKMPVGRQFRLYLASGSEVTPPHWVRLGPKGRGSLTFAYRGRIWDLAIDVFGRTFARPTKVATNLRFNPPERQRGNRFIVQAGELLRNFDFSQPKAVSLARRIIARAIHPDRAVSQQERHDRTDALAWANSQLDALGHRVPA